MLMHRGLLGESVYYVGVGYEGERMRRDKGVYRRLTTNVNLLSVYNVELSRMNSVIRIRIDLTRIVGMRDRWGIKIGRLGFRAQLQHIFQMNW